MDVENDQPDEGLELREPSVEDLVGLCVELNSRGALYLVVGGFAVRGAGFIRATMNIDLVIDSSLENEAKVYDALRTLPDRAVDQLDPGDVEKFTVVRVADEIVVDLMKSASGIGYEMAKAGIVMREVDGVMIPFASPELLWQMKRTTQREKDGLDLLFLRKLIEGSGGSVPE